jgi:GrpB-like predicted nucleotidyltransferase (UPF0157 family)
MSAEKARAMSAGDGLERHPSLDERFDPAVRIVEYDPAWAAQAHEELRRLKEALGPVAVRLEHVGSTAVPGLAAKPILDLQLSVAAFAARSVRRTAGAARLRLRAGPSRRPRTTGEDDAAPGSASP